ncbi:hypothetical protein [Actinoplanes couchii]|uniref:Uncharacterized protein n=1 Tax=Actinoplanes couchii TaxID=403638 RepID=A0ABQ3XP70_9ACTN|nr:hypothetical protein [Actinoplanes couchii]MDR6318601.1 hypothetical protein [Actinoplanes couchii]GID60210.1 hypothetical protein Aco03nite_086140 [Actinoplanes couchii]
MTIQDAVGPALVMGIELDEVDPQADDACEAAALWENVMLGAESRREWVRADRARLFWAWCLHRQGRCDDAVMALLAIGDSGRAGAVTAQILCLRLMGWCSRHDEAAAVWIRLDTGTTPLMRWSALNDLLHPANRALNDFAGRTHGKVCVFDPDHLVSAPRTGSEREFRTGWASSRDPGRASPP